MQVKGIKRAAVGVCDGNGKGFPAGASTGIDDGRRGNSGDRRADKSCAKGAGFVLNEEKTFIEAGKRFDRSAARKGDKGIPDLSRTK